MRLHIVKADIDEYWWLEKSLTNNDSLLLIQNPVTLENTHGRPRNTNTFNNNEVSVFPAS